tara:strand:- start:21 stop:197 length:177 start_codon:yes stop_codon:yes gene_type:complete
MIKIKLTEDIIYKGKALKKGSILRSQKESSIKEYIENNQAIVIFGKLKTIKKKQNGNS